MPSVHFRKRVVFSLTHFLGVSILGVDRNFSCSGSIPILKAYVDGTALVDIGILAI